MSDFINYSKTHVFRSLLNGTIVLVAIGNFVFLKDMPIWQTIFLVFTIAQLTQTYLDAKREKNDSHK